MLQPKQISKWSWVVRALILLFFFFAILSVRDDLQEKGLGTSVEAGLGLSGVTPLVRKATFKDKAE